MQITVNRADLATAFAWAVKGLPKYAVTPVLQGMRLEVSGDTLTFATFDYERAQRSHVAGVDSEPGVILVTGADLKKIVAALPKRKNVTATFIADDASLVVESGGVTWTLDALPIAEYPQLPEMPELAGVIDGAAFARAGKRVSAIAGKDDKLPVLTCVLFEPGSDALTMAATDRYRMAVEPVSWTAQGEPAGEYAVPAKPLAEFAAKADKSGKVHVYLGADAPDASHFRAGFRDDSRELIITCNSGQFPRYRNLIPTDAMPVNVLTNAATLGAAIKQLAPMCEKNEPVILNCTQEEITVSATSGGKVVASMTVPGMTDVYPTEVRFNPEYIMSILAGFDGDVWIGIKPNRIATVNADGDEFRALIVPTRNANG